MIVYGTASGAVVRLIGGPINALASFKRRSTCSALCKTPNRQPIGWRFGVACCVSSYCTVTLRVAVCVMLGLAAVCPVDATETVAVVVPVEVPGELLPFPQPLVAIIPQNRMAKTMSWRPRSESCLRRNPRNPARKTAGNQRKLARVA